MSVHSEMVEQPLAELLTRIRPRSWKSHQKRDC